MAPALTLALQQLGCGRDLTVDQAAAATAAIISGEASEVAMGAFLTALRVKGETADELAGAVGEVRERMASWDVSPRPYPILDTCGTGGDGALSVNI